VAAPATNAEYSIATMLTHLHIRDLAIVDSVELDFTAGLTVLTGETGAGKSIVVDALTLICGARAAADQVRAGAEKAEIAATFDIRKVPRALRDLLAEQSIEADDELLVRRVVNIDGRSRAYLNGQSVPVQQLRDIVGQLLDVHGQHEFQSLVRSNAQRGLLDGYGRLEPLAEQVEASHRVWLALLNRLLEIESRLRDREARIELLRFQESELAALALKPGEVAELVAEAARLGNRGRLLEGTQLAAQLLYEGDDNTAQARIARAQSVLKPLLAVDPALESVMPLLEEASIRVMEATRELSHYAESLDMDNARQAVVEKRLAAAEELARKHRIATNELPARQITLRGELNELESAEQDVNTLRRQQGDALNSYRSLALKLSESRTVAAKTFSKEITARMQTLGMGGGRFQVEVAPHDSAEPQPHGLDQIEFRVTANAGQPLRPLAKVASGGELARLSLAVQVACTTDEPRCMVFDEVDAGIGGAVAEIVGNELRALGSRSQVLCVTHLPQVASRGHHHLRVLKLSDGKTTRTSLAELTGDERVQEVARMLGGVQITDKALAHAREMLAAPSAKTGDTAKIKRGKPRQA
jgi:DNA repair protein RecN (Recombination protein N)